MRLSEFFERYVFVRKCVSCGELLSYDERADAFCPSCRIGWERAKAKSCNECTQSMIECLCMPKKLSKAGMPALCKLASYSAIRAAEPENRLIYFLKRNRNKRVFGFVASQLEERLRSFLDENDLEAKDVVLTYVPRSKRSVAKHGFDQSRLVCEALGELMGIEVLALLSRKRGRAKEQKRLGVSAREKNVKGIFEINFEELNRVNNRTVILFDDVVTSGASMAEVMRMLTRRKIMSIYGLCIAYTLKK